MIPQVAPSTALIEPARAIPGVLDATEKLGELTLTIDRDAVLDVLRALRDSHAFQQLMSIAGVDFPSRAERFEVVYELLSLTKNQRVRVKLSTDEDTPVRSVTSLWPVAGWFEREIWDLYGVPFEGNADLRRILTDYGFQGHPFRKDFPMTGYLELRYSEEHKRVIYEPVKLAQDFRTFDFLSPWEGAQYLLPGDDKASGQTQAAPAPMAADAKANNDARGPVLLPADRKTS